MVQNFDDVEMASVSDIPHAVDEEFSAEEIKKLPKLIPPAKAR